MRSIKAASVEDLPDPLPPVTRMMPLRTLAASSSCGGKVQGTESWNDGGNNAHHDRATAALDENIDAEARRARQSVGDVAGALLAQRADGLLVGADQVGGDAARVIGRKHAMPASSTARQLPVNLDLRRASGREDQVAHLFRGAQHAGQQNRGRNRASPLGLRRQLQSANSPEQPCHTLQ